MISQAVQKNFQTLEERIHDCKILIVDDSPLNRELIKSYISSVGFTDIILAEDGEQALEAIFGQSPDFVILDIVMSGMDGFEVLERVRANDAYQDLPIFVQTALSQEERLKVFNCGATGLLMKPVSQAELLSSLKAHLQATVLIRDLQEYNQRVTKDLELARAMQFDLLPNANLLDTIEQNMNISIHSEFITSEELGGDLWGVDKLSDDKIVVYVLDFSGHGITAALNTFRLSAFLKQALKTIECPKDFMSKINKHLFDNLPTGQFATMFLGILDTKTNIMKYATASSPSPFVVDHKNKSINAGDGKGFPLGIIEDAEFEIREIEFNKDSTLFLYSDGMSEACDHKGEMFGEKGIRSILKTNISEKRFFDSVLRDFRVRRGDQGTEDDLTVVGVNRRA